MTDGEQQPPVPDHDAVPVGPPPGHPVQPPPGAATPQQAAQLDPTAPLPGLLFSSSYRTPRTRWWRGLVSIIIVITAVIVLSFVFSFLAIAIDLALGIQTTDALMSGEVSMTPALLAATNLSLVTAAVLSLLAHRYVNGVRWGLFHSVAGRLRWSWLLLTFGLVAPVYLLFALSSFLDPAYRTIELNGTVIAFLVIIVLTTPLQAAAEEYMFRGVIQRSVGSWFRSSLWALAAGTAASAIVFSAAHFAQDAWLIVYYFCFGVLLSLLTQRTGGLESAIAIHTANNLFLLIVSAVSGQMAQGFDRSAGVGGPFMLIPILLLLVVVGLLSLLAKRRRLAVTTGPDAAHPGDAPSNEPRATPGQRVGE